jgi:transketolase
LRVVVLGTGTLVPAPEHGTSGLVVTAEEHSILGGLGGAVAEVLSEHRPTPLVRVGVHDVYAESAPNDALLEKYGVTARHVAEAARSHLAKWRR